MFNDTSDVIRFESFEKFLEAALKVIRCLLACDLIVYLMSLWVYVLWVRVSFYVCVHMWFGWSWPFILPLCVCFKQQYFWISVHLLHLWLRTTTQIVYQPFDWESLYRCSHIQQHSNGHALLEIADAESAFDTVLQFVCTMT